MTGSSRPPLVVARAVVRLALVLVPRGPLRSRWTSELDADLAQLPRRQQPAFAVRVLLRSWALRRAVRTVGPDSAAHVPIGCMIGLSHNWHLEHTEDGSLYWRCRRCGKDDDGLWRRSFGIDRYHESWRGTFI